MKAEFFNSWAVVMLGVHCGCFWLFFRGNYKALRVANYETAVEGASVFLSVGCCNKIPQAGWINNRNLFRTVLQDQGACKVDFILRPFLLAWGGTILLCAHRAALCVETEQALSSLSVRALSPS